MALLFLLGPTAAHARDQTRASEPAVKAAYLFNFAQFVRWPAGAVEAGRPFNICIIGRDPFGSALDATLAHESLDGHPAAVRRIATTTEAETCQLVFIPATEEPRLDPLLRAIAGKPVLTVSDIPRFVDRGGMIQFVSVDKRVRFEINLDATEAVKLAPSSELARVAVAVHRTPAAQ